MFRELFHGEKTFSILNWAKKMLSANFMIFRCSDFQINLIASSLEQTDAKTLLLAILKITEFSEICCKSRPFCCFHEGENKEFCKIFWFFAVLSSKSAFSYN